jgi:hypothetical protein
MKDLLKKLSQFEMHNISSGSYVQFMHLVSSVILTTTTPRRCSEELITLLPMGSLFAPAILSFANSFRDNELEEISALTKKIGS